MLGGRSFWYRLAYPGLKQKTAEDFWLTEEQVNRRKKDGVEIQDRFSDVLPLI
jgi:hypothetical protein